MRAVAFTLTGGAAYLLHNARHHRLDGAKPLHNRERYSFALSKHRPAGGEYHYIYVSVDDDGVPHGGAVIII